MSQSYDERTGDHNSRITRLENRVDDLVDGLAHLTKTVGGLNGMLGAIVNHLSGMIGSHEKRLEKAVDVGFQRYAQQMGLREDVNEILRRLDDLEARGYVGEPWVPVGPPLPGFRWDSERCQYVEIEGEERP